MRYSTSVAGVVTAAAMTVLLTLPARTVAAELLISPDGEAAGDQFGRAVASAGDVNGDGFDDLIVGARSNDVAGSSAGRAYIYFGGPASDSIADVTFTGFGMGQQFGFAVGGAGDVNGDGFADVIVGARFENEGRAYVFFGGPTPDTTADRTYVGEAPGDQFGVAVGSAGDVNGDGFADLIVGARLAGAVAGSRAGRAYVFHGGPVADELADLTLNAEADGDEFGFSVGSAGDTNGDGFDDVIVGARLNDAGGTNAGRAYVFLGGPMADDVADLKLTGEAAVDNFGSRSPAPATSTTMALLT